MLGFLCEAERELRLIYVDDAPIGHSPSSAASRSEAKSLSSSSSTSKPSSGSSGSSATLRSSGILLAATSSRSRAESTILSGPSRPISTLSPPPARKAQNACCSCLHCGFHQFRQKPRRIPAVRFALEIAVRPSSEKQTYGLNRM